MNVLQIEMKFKKSAKFYRQLFENDKNWLNFNKIIKVLKQPQKRLLPPLSSKQIQTAAALASPAKRHKAATEVESFRLKLSKADSALETARAELRTQTEAATRLKKESAAALRAAETAARAGERALATQLDARERESAELRKRLGEVEAVCRWLLL